MPTINIPYPDSPACFSSAHGVSKNVFIFRHTPVLGYLSPDSPGIILRNCYTARKINLPYSIINLHSSLQLISCKLHIVLVIVTAFFNLGDSKARKAPDDRKDNTCVAETCPGRVLRGRHSQGRGHIYTGQ